MTPEELQASMRRVQELQEEISKGLTALNDQGPIVSTTAAPAPVAGIANQQVAVPANRYLSIQEKIKFREALHKMSDAELSMTFSAQAGIKDTGVPLDHWLNTAGYSAQVAWERLHGQVAPDTMKALDTGGASALIRQDLEPILYEIYIRIFPAYDRFPKEPANGLVHAWNQITGYGGAKFMAELGTVTDDTSTYVRQTTNVAILATRRGISLKSQFAVVAGGMNYNPEQLELNAGLRAMAHTMQNAIFGGNATNTGGTSSDENGAYDANAFTGLRYLLGIAAGGNTPQNLDPATAPTTTGNFRNAVNAAVLPITQNGGQPSIIWGHPQEKITFDQQQDPNFRILAGQDQYALTVGVTAERFSTIAGPLPFAIVPGDSIGNYTAASYSSNNVRDLYILQEDSVSLPYLGSEGPTVLDIPIGISGQLTHLFVIFDMKGLAVKSLLWNNKVRVKVA